ncbi:U11/U12 small nuclear ribonucleoprotein 35 kDa protein-like [Chelonus insularis]|uniref:U11/U12 small nuclear ribonucleoprotein 35 kDa protein-like n=1 Tax=Chelonus insularis TaxID=460826 RepID=UPI00158BE8C8|nr:U11/U12 small nuclear ribonucleoprotein 35 kDa protein-like [Chelonus insularis]
MVVNLSVKMSKDVMKNWSPYAKVYEPLKAGSIDGTDTEPHDRAITRAIRSYYAPPPQFACKSVPSRTLFVARFSPKTTKQHLIELFSTVGEVISAKIIVDIVTGQSQCYGFVEMSTDDETRRAVRRLNEASLKGYKIFVDFECGRTMEGWKPRRLGGGFGGRKESGQLRFGGRDRPFKKPIITNIKSNQK